MRTVPATFSLQNALTVTTPALSSTVTQWLNSVSQPALQGTMMTGTPQNSTVLRATQTVWPVTVQMRTIVLAVKLRVRQSFIRLFIRVTRRVLITAPRRLMRIRGFAMIVTQRVRLVVELCRIIVSLVRLAIIYLGLQTGRVFRTARLRGLPIFTTTMSQTQNAPSAQQQLSTSAKPAVPPTMTSVSLASLPTPTWTRESASLLAPQPPFSRKVPQSSAINVTLPCFAILASAQPLLAQAVLEEECSKGVCVRPHVTPAIPISQGSAQPVKHRVTRARDQQLDA